MNQDLKYTLNLPQTAFPMRADAVVRESRRLEHWKKQKLYQRIQEQNKSKEAFILHDGPPFTNGDVHVGTALNKILKDIILRYKTMRGYRTPYIPGWDCHGLPIEYKVTKQLREEHKDNDLSVAQLRQACADFSKGYIQRQQGQFERLGVLADWDQAYRTLDPEYEADILRTFASFVEQGLVYRSKKPVYWSIPCQTALAEAEIEYKEHVSPSIWVAFPLKHPEQKNDFVVIWTTTPWTLPANLAITVNPKTDYVWVQHEERRYLVAKALADNFALTCKLEGYKVNPLGPGSTLEGWVARHPLLDRDSPIVSADYVTTESGTGCVHTAPGHGPDDYLTGLRYGLDIYSPIDDAGCYLSDGQIPESWVGACILDSKKGANVLVLESLRSSGFLLHEAQIKHSYPHCWRSKTPLIFRATSQWFISLEKNELRQKLIEQTNSVSWIPEWGASRIQGFLKDRPDWCISRQRRWGVPLPVFYDENGEAYIDAQVIRSLADKVATHGSNIWFEGNAKTLLESIDIPDSWKGKSLVPGQDTLDVWMDSGTSHRAVLQRNKGLKWPADLCLEGSDQHRGWFQSLLWTGVVADGQAPYKKVLTHGFIVREDGKKVSKSEGPAQTAESYVSRYGADILRLWIASENYRNDIPLSESILKQVIHTYRSFRNTFRFQLGNLYDFDYEKDAISSDALDALDQWVLFKTDQLIEVVTQAYESYQFHRAYQELNVFCVNVLSARYHDILKDRLYTRAPADPLRRSSQTAMYRVYHVWVRLLAPILLFTADEAFGFIQDAEDGLGKSVHLEPWPEAQPSLYKKDTCLEVEMLMQFRSQVNEAIEGARKEKIVGQSLDAHVRISGGKNVDNQEVWSLLQRYKNALSEVFIVSAVDLVQTDEHVLSVYVEHAQGVRCPRSWRWVDTLVEVPPFGAVSERCKEALLSKK